MTSRTVVQEARNHTSTITVVGLGHVGLPTALGFAELGWNVIGADCTQDKVEMLQNGHSPFFEPGMQELLSKHLGNPRLRFTADVDEALRDGSIIFICVGTPHGIEGEADLSQVESLARRIAANLNGYKLIVEKSTVPAATGTMIRRTILQAIRARGGTAPRFDVASNPEFLQEGTAMRDFFAPERIVCGVDSRAGREILAALYAGFDRPLLFTELSTAELIKHSANAFLALKVSFINMVADVCEAVGADVSKVANGIGMDPRIGRRFLEAGLGFGGYCLPKDLRAFRQLAEQNNVDAALLTAIERVNTHRLDRFLSKLEESLWVLQGKTVAVLGLAFKAGTDDMREAVSVRLIEQLRRRGVIVRAYDPKAMNTARAELSAGPDLIFCSDAYEAVQGAHAALIVTEWDEFKSLDLGRLRKEMALPVVIDGRNLFSASAMRDAGFEYACMGRLSKPPVARRAQLVLRATNGKTDESPADHAAAA